MGFTIESVDDTQGNIKHPKRELNLLIIGGTGVGKTTFFNSIINYLKFENLEEALKCQDRDSLYTIPVNVNIWPNGEKCLNFDVGNVENFKIGESVTKYCTTYRVELPNGLIINFTDTPGVGDTRGVAKDKENFENILDELAEIKLLHGIVLLLDPKENKLSTAFKYCINELFTRLHSSARNNLFFVFTKTRGEMFRPGTGLGILKEYLSQLKSSTNIEISTDQRVFCVDNEAFAYLMAKKFTNQNFEDGDEECYSSSWRKSTLSVLKLIESIQKIEPHKVSESICINSARNMINKTIFPLTQCIDRITKKEKSLADFTNQLIENEKNYEILKDLLLATINQTENFPLPHPFIFCVHPDCEKDKSDYDGKEIEGHLCEDGDITLKKDSWLYFRNCIGLFGSCKKCGHSCSSHKTEVNASYKTKVLVEDIKVKSEMCSTSESIIQLKNQKIKTNELELEALHSEKEILCWGLLKFSIFLHHYSLVPVNLDFGDYIKKEIEEKEKDKTKNEKDLKNLYKLLDEFNNYQQCLNENLDKNTSGKFTVPKPDSIFEIIRKVENLEITSEYLQKAIITQHRSIVSLDPSEKEKKEKTHVTVNKLSNLVNVALNKLFS